MKPLNQSKLNTKWSEFKAYLDRRVSGIMTGIPCLDNYLLGLGCLVNVQGEESSCKSSFGLQLLHHNLLLGHPGLVIDKENGTGRLMLRLICQANKISEKEFLDAPDEMKKVYSEKIDAYRVHIHTEPIIQIEDFVTRVREFDKAYDHQPFTVLFDSIQAADSVDESQRISLEKWVYALDSLKLEMAGRATIIFISEKNRMSFGTQGTGGGKGSNVVDYKPETVLDIKWNESSDTFTIKVSKHRDGLKGTKFELRKVMSQADNPRSFTFLLEETELEATDCALDKKPALGTTFTERKINVVRGDSF